MKFLIFNFCFFFPKRVFGIHCVSGFFFFYPFFKSLELHVCVYVCTVYYHAVSIRS